MLKGNGPAPKVVVVGGSLGGLFAVVWLLSDDARYITGHTLPVDGGVCAV